MVWFVSVALLLLYCCASVTRSDLPSSWLGSSITAEELMGVDAITTFLANKGTNSSFVMESTDIDRLRFLRQQRGNVEKAADSLIEHARWRESEHGSEGIMRSHLREQFDVSVLNDEFIWIGTSEDNCPTLVVRSQLHDGADYDEDPRLFVKYLVYMLERGRREWGIGPERGFCMIVDRTDAVRRSTGEVMTDQFDFSVIPNLIELFRVIYSTLNENYPKLLVRAQVVPTSWFYSTCWGFVSKLMDQSISNKFEVIQERDIAERLARQFPKEMLPKRFGGTADDFVRATMTTDMNYEMLSEKRSEKEMQKESVAAAPDNYTAEAWGDDTTSLPPQATMEIPDASGKNVNPNNEEVEEDFVSFIVRIVEADGYDSAGNF